MKNQKLHSFSIFAGGISFLLSAQISSACIKIPDADFSLIGSYEAGNQLSRGNTTEFDLPGCKNFDGQYLVLVSAPIYTTPQFTGISSPEGELPEESCFIDNSPFDVSKPQDVHIEEFYQSETKFLNTCLEAEVTDLSGLIDATQQINCEVTPVSLNKVIVKGPRCAFKISEKSEFKVNYRLNQACLNKKYLKDVGDLRPMDIKASLQIIKTPNLDPENKDYDILSMNNARITLQPGKDLIPVSSYSGTVGSEWPMQFGAQIEMGKVNLSSTPRLHSAPYVFLRTPFLVNNNCKEICKDGICTSPCDFYAPIGANMTLAKKAVGDTNFHGIDFWYQGNVAPPRFVGEISLGRAINDPQIQKGDRYLLTAEFSNPALTYRTIMEEAKQLLIRLEPISIITRNAGRSGGLTGLVGFGDMGSNFLPETVDLPSLGQLNEGELDIGPMLRSLNQYIGVDDTWPPYYNTVINGDQTDNANRVYLKLKVGFRVSSISPFGAIVMDQITYFKESKIFGNYIKPVNSPRQIKCTH